MIFIDDEIEIERDEIGHVIRPTFVYFIRCTATGLIKIGWSNNPTRRLEQFQAGSGARLRLVHAFPGDVSLEQELHRRFNDGRRHGEWFQITIEEARDAIRLGDVPESPHAVDLLARAVIGKWHRLSEACSVGGCARR